MKKLIIFGNREVAEAAWFYFCRDSDRAVAAFTIDGNYCDAPEFCGLPLVPFEEITRSYPPETFDMFIALGYQNANRLRQEKFLQAEEKGYDFASYVSSRAVVWPERIGRNCFIHDHNVVQPFAHIGDNVVLWTANVIGHHARIENHSFVAGHAAIAGKAVIGEGSFIGANSTIRDGITIGRRCVIGAGTVILKSTKDEEVFASARPIRFP